MASARVRMEAGWTRRPATSGRLTETGFSWKSFNGRLRDECLNQHWFRSLGDARQIVEEWRLDYNQARPHSALGGLTPEEYRLGITRSEAGVQSLGLLTRNLA